MAILVIVLMDEQGRTITKTKTKYTRIIDDMTTNIGTVIYVMQQSENQPRQLLEQRGEELCGLSPQQNDSKHF